MYKSSHHNRSSGASSHSSGGPRSRSSHYSGRAKPFGSSQHSSRGGFRAGRGGGGGGRNFKGQYIDPAKFINKVVVLEEADRFVPEHNFADFQIDERLKKTISNKGYVTPTPIQDRTIPLILKGRDVVGVANTGTGKTAAFLIPLINKVLANPKEQVLIVVPTRELAIQIDEELNAFARGLRIFSVSCVGGVPIFKQIRDLRKEHNFIIGTPGRLKDLIGRGDINLAPFA